MPVGFARPLGVSFDLIGTLVQRDALVAPLETMRQELRRNALYLHLGPLCLFLTSNDQGKERWLSAQPFASVEAMMHKLGKFKQSVIDRVVNDITKSIEEAALYPEVLDVLRRLQEWHVPMVLITNLGQPWAGLIPQLGLDHFFPRPIASWEQGCIKPDLAMYEAGIGQLGLSADRILYIGDEPETDFFGPQRAGMNPLLLDRFGRYPTINPRTDSLRGVLPYFEPHS